FRIVDKDGYFVPMRGNDQGVWEPQYRFTLEPFGFADYEEMCRFHQTSPQSHFTQNVICSRATEDGRITLSGMNLITTSGPERLRREQTLESQEEYEGVLRDQFGVVMNTEKIFG